MYGENKYELLYIWLNMYEYNGLGKYKFCLVLLIK